MNSIRWHRRMEARVAAGVILLVAISLLAIIAGRHARGDEKRDDARLERPGRTRATPSTARRRSRVDRRTTNPAHHHASGIPLGDDQPRRRRRRGHADADGRRLSQDLGAQFAILTTPEGTPTALPGWPTGTPLPPGLQAVIRGAASGASRRDIVPVDGRLFLVTAEPATFAQSELLGTVTFGFPARQRRCRPPGPDHTRGHQLRVGQPARGKQPERCRTARESPQGFQPAI